MSFESEIVIIGAGVVGLTIAAELSRTNKKLFIFEKNHSFGLETSSRNSEVIHAGMYYPENSLKAKFCVIGNHLLYEFCKKYHINHKRIGKLIVAANSAETLEIERLYDQGRITASMIWNCLHVAKSDDWNQMWRQSPAYFHLPPGLSIPMVCCYPFTIWRKTMVLYLFLMPK